MQTACHALQPCYIRVWEVSHAVVSASLAVKLPVSLGASVGRHDLPVVVQIEKPSDTAPGENDGLDFASIRCIKTPAQFLII